MGNHSTIVIKTETHFKRFRESDFPGGNRRDNNPMTDAVESVFHDAIYSLLEDYVHEDEFETRLLNKLEDESLLPKKVDGLHDLGEIKISLERTEKEVKIQPLTDAEILACEHEWDLDTCRKCGCKVIQYRNAYNKNKHKGLSEFV